VDATETAQLAVQVTKDELDEQSVLRLYNETEGNPLFVIEMASAGLSHAPREAESRVDVSDRPLSTANLPPRMYAVIAGRLAQLSPETRELAGLAATVGRVFTIDILSKASGGDADKLTNELDELWQRRIVRPAPQPSLWSGANMSTGELFGAVANSFDFSHDSTGIGRNLRRQP
jgi:predicted ATPase